MKFPTVVSSGFLVLMTVLPANALSLSFSWGDTKDCNDSKSPPLSVSDVPDATKKLRFLMVDLDAPANRHGGATVTWRGNGAFAYGAFIYKGPCTKSQHTYQFTVEALDVNNRVLATATAKRPFP